MEEADNMEYMYTRNGKAYVGDIVIDGSHKNEEVEILGFFQHTKSTIGTMMVSFDRGSPIDAHGGTAWRDYTLKTKGE